LLALLGAHPILHISRIRVKMEKGCSNVSGWDIFLASSVKEGFFHKENPARCNSVSKFYFIFV